MKIQGLIFDLGHTLIELPEEPEALRQEMFAAALKALRSHGIPVEEAALVAAVEHWMGLRYGRWKEDWREYPLVETFALALGELGYKELSREVVREVVRAFLTPQEARWRPFPDTFTTLEELHRRNYRLALLTNSGDADHSWRLIDRFGLRRYFDPIVISAVVGWRKPHPALFLGIAEAWRLPPQAIVVVGDLLEADIQGAHLAGMRGIWAAMGAEPMSSPNHARPDAVIHSLGEILAVLSQWENGG
ncbi:HAD family hydrolase [Thermoflexus sp.]|uniref:HAD family hydrolase n=1 Tax=Thermoflexus sp. TaxID=1969742 RepID=UPI002ADDA1BA|nr:HAD family hydrolase [Thermoflexus sp.]